MSILVTTKIIGTAATGIWASYNAALATSYSELKFLPAVFGIPGLQGDLKSSIARATDLASIGGIGALSFGLSWLMSPKSGKHPYLLYVSVGSLLISLLQYRGAMDLVNQANSHESGEEERSELTGSVYEKIGSDHDLSLTNKCTVYTRVVAGLSAAVYLVNLVGLAGDSF